LPFPDLAPLSGRTLIAVLSQDKLCENGDIQIETFATSKNSSSPDFHLSKTPASLFLPQNFSVSTFSISDSPANLSGICLNQ
jgi:hypothetical protein